jgi:hypothetical protein
MPNVGDCQPMSRNAQGIMTNGFNLGSANSAVFSLYGGLYALDVVASGSGSVTLERLGPDGSTFISTALTLSATGTIQGQLPPGEYKLVVATLTAVYACVVEIPT